MLRLNRLVFLLLACSIHLFSTAQTTTCSADFNYSVGNNNVVSFFAGDTLHSVHRWTFGDGTAILHTGDGVVAHTFAKPGKYEVKHFIEKPNSNCRDSVVKIITVEWLDACSAAFNYLKEPGTLSYKFYNNSISYTGIKTSVWGFGDGTTSNDLNPAHVYTKPGSYTVCLKIVTNNGCTSDFCGQLQVIDSSNVCNIISRFEYRKDSADCKKIFFTNLTYSSASNMQFSWKFGDGSSSQEKNPVHAFTQPGKYYVCLVTESGNNCRKEYCDTVNIDCDIPCAINARFEWNKDSADCRKVRFISVPSTVVTNLKYAWKFGDGDGSFDASPAHIYNQPGSYQVCLVVSYSSCSKYYCDTVTVRCSEDCKIQPLFSFSKESAAPNKVSFKNLTVYSADVHYSWHFGDGSSSNDKNPVHVYTQPGKYNACLVAETNNCRKEICQQIEIKTCDVTARFETKQDGNKPNTIYFQNVSKPVTNIWQTYWTYGDGASSRDFNSLHEYEKPAVYNVCLKVIGLGGCTSTYCDTVRIVKKDSCRANASFNYYSSSASSLSFKFEALNANNNAAYYWNFGDSTAGAGRFAYHEYKTPGKYTVCLKVKDSFCTATYCKEITIEKPANGRVATFPNPATNTVSLELALDRPGQVLIRILDANGSLKAQYSKDGTTGSNHFTLPVEQLSQGLYLVEIKTSTGQWLSRFIKG